ncbi:hypothetical protein Tco_0489631 [Tanacetum coccineum]
METEDVQDEKRNEGTEKGNEGTDKGNEGIDKQDGGTDSTKVSTERQCEGIADQNEGKSVTQTAPTPTLTTPTPITPTLTTPTPITPTPTVFGDDETIAQETERPWPTSTRSILTLRPLPKIDLKDKGKKRIEEEDESDTESEEKRLDEEEAIKVALFNEYDFIQVRLNADKILAETVQEEERERDIKRSDDSFIAIGSAEDEKMIKEMNEQAADASKKRVKKDDSVKGEIKEEEGPRKRKLGKRKKMKSKKRKFTSKDDEVLRWVHTIMTDEGLVIHMFVEDKYPLKKEVLSQLIELKLETEEDSTMALELIRFVKKQIAELEPKDSDGDEEDP